MCLIIHKPAGVEIPGELLAAAAAHNPHGWGLMGFDTNGKPLIQRRTTVDVAELIDVEHALRDSEYVLHLRRQTNGGSGLDNVHPFKVIDGVWLMHNGGHLALRHRRAAAARAASRRPAQRLRVRADPRTRLAR